MYDGSMMAGVRMVQAPPELTKQMVEKFVTRMFRTKRRLRLHRDARFRSQLPDAVLVMPDDVPSHPYAVA